MQTRQKLIGYGPTIAAMNIVFGLLFGSSFAHAQNVQGERLFEEENKLMADGKLAQACTAFEASNRIEPLAGTLIWRDQATARIVPVIHDRGPGLAIIGGSS